MAAPVLEAFNSYGPIDNFTTDKVIYPAGNAGDLYILLVAIEYTSNNYDDVLEFNTPSWTLLQWLGNSTQDAHLWVYYQFATSSKNGTTDGVVVREPLNTEGVAFLLRVTGADPTKPFGTDINTGQAIGGSNNEIFIGTLTRDDTSKDQLAITFCSYDGGDGEIGLTNTSGWDNYNTDRATSHSALVSAGRYLGSGTGSQDGSGAFSTQTKTGSGGVNSVTWSFAKSDGAVGVSFTINPASTSFKGYLGDLAVTKMYLGDVEATGAYLGDIDLFG